MPATVDLKSQDETTQENSSGIKKTKKQIEQIKTVKDQVTQINETLKAVMEAAHGNHSLLSRGALFWSRLRTWQKIAIGTVLFGVMIAIGIVTHIIALIVFSIVGSLIYTVSSFLLDDHAQNNKQAKEKLDEGVNGLTQLLESTILLLDSIGQQLLAAVDDFRLENARLERTATDLQKKVERLNTEVSELATTKQALQETQSKLSRLTTDFSDLNETLASTRAQFVEVEKDLNAQIADLAGINEILKGTTGQLIAFKTKNEQAQQLFLKNINEFVTQGTGAFAEQIRQFSTIAEELISTKEAIDRSLKGRDDLLEQYRKELIQLLPRPSAPTPSITTVSIFEKGRSGGVTSVLPPVDSGMSDRHTAGSIAANSSDAVLAIRSTSPTLR